MSAEEHVWLEGRRYPACACERFCGDSDPEGPGVCKDLAREPEPPLVSIVLVDRRSGEVVA